MGIRRMYRKFVLKYGTQPMVISTLRKMGVRIGDRCRIYTPHFGSEPYLITIGDHVCISNDVTFVNHQLNWPFQDKYESLTGFAPIVIKDNCQIGVNVTILPGVTIGPNSIVGAGSVVAKDVPPDSVAAGNPAKVITTLEAYEQKCVEGHIDIPVDREAARAALERHFYGRGA